MSGTVGPRLSTIPPTHLLEEYPGASCAYSLRLLDSTYTGNCIKVRRDSDNTETAIGFTYDVVTDSMVLDRAAITTFCGGSGSGIAGYVTTWFDQSGNGLHLTQSVSTSQLVIVTNGDTFYMWNGHPRIKDWGRRGMSTGFFTTIPAGSSFTQFNCCYSEGHGNFWGIFNSPGGGSYYDGLLGGVGLPFVVWGAYYVTIFTGTITPPSAQFTIATTIRNDQPLDTSLYVNGVFDNSVDNYTPQAYSSFRISYNSSTTEAGLAEQIIYPEDKSADRAAIDQNIIDYYGI